MRLFLNETAIDDWSIDFEDIDQVLRIVARSGITKNKVVELVNSVGYQCED